MKSMTPRERVRTALNHEEPDRVPFILGGCTTTGITIQAYEKLKKYLGLDSGKTEFYSEYLQIVRVEEPVCQALDIDIRIIPEKAPEGSSVYDKEKDMITDEWGIQYQRPKGSLYYDICNAPLGEATIDDLDSYPWPDPEHPGRLEGLLDEARELYDNTSYAIFGDTPGNNLFEMAWAVRGMEQFLKDMIINKDFVHALMRKITDIQKKRAERYLSLVGDYIEIFRTSDDLGTQHSLMMSPEMYREMIKPYHKEYFDLIKQYTDAKIFYHSCGAVFPMIEDIIEVGVDILNPVQVSCKNMDTRNLKEKFGDRLSFCGGIDTQSILPTGTPDDVANEVKRRIKDLAPGGGYLLNAVHTIQADVPPENIVRLYEAGKQYGTYPLPD
ncbi:uroporphyrinogen decarboxylase [Desulfosarcina widdelii]|uniref:Uroporphyrinogen decarboxylase n=1 Tax=Desulfosarcina widdelii TaxID=947919 RepID=A0A5K7YZ40_9BACT|nr:uroporphyrinogen decarboxylase family protein [Desulfosarcina widdelii]BBO73249.1 uroporphyrinogen decarboxylase [Desulfosarcina widdelii]